MTQVKAGKFYEMTTKGFMETTAQPPDLWICRRVEDFPPGALEKLPGVGIGACSRCSAAIAFNTAHAIKAKKTCMRCAGLTPDPYPT